MVSSIDRFAAVLNGTSNFILSALERDRGTFADALAGAQQRGLTEPDPSRDIDGDDAADKLALLASLFGWGTVPRAALEVRSLRNVSSTDLRVARDLGGALKPVALASRVPGGIEACIGPTWVPSHSPLAALSDTLNGIELHGRYVRNLFFSGPSAGPQSTAATLLDDVVQALRAGQAGGRRANAPGRASWVTAPLTPWFIRVEFPGVVPTVHVVEEVLGRTGIAIEHVTGAIENMRYVLAGPANRTLVEVVLDTVQRRHRLQCVAFRRMV